MRLIDADALIKEIKMDIEDVGLQEKMVFYRINEALQAEPSDGDLISRQDAIDAVENNSYGMGSRASVKAIKALPSADAVEVVRCGECRFYLQSNEKCELVDTRLHFYETDKTWTGDCYCSWGERREP